jgi:hypothetical protein
MSSRVVRAVARNTMTIPHVKKIVSRKTRISSANTSAWWKDPTIYIHCAQMIVVVYIVFINDWCHRPSKYWINVPYEEEIQQHNRTLFDNHPYN